MLNLEVVSQARSSLRAGDVLLELAGVRVGRDGCVPFPDASAADRVPFAYVVQARRVDRKEVSSCERELESASRSSGTVEQVCSFGEVKICFWFKDFVASACDGCRDLRRNDCDGRREEGTRAAVGLRVHDGAVCKWRRT